MFETYKEAQDWIEAQKAKHGRAFFSTEEYKNTYPEIQKLYKMETPKKAKRTKVISYIGGATLLAHN